MDDSTPAPTCGSCGAWLARHRSARFCPGCGAPRPEADLDITVQHPSVVPEETGPMLGDPEPVGGGDGRRPGRLPRVVALLSLLGLVLDLVLPPLGRPVGSAPVWESSYLRVDYQLWRLTGHVHRTFAVEWVLTFTLVVAAFTIVAGIVTVCGCGRRAPFLFAGGGAATGVLGIVTPHVYSLHGASGTAAWGALLAGLCILMAGLGIGLERLSLLRLAPMVWKPWVAVGCVGLLGLAGGGYPALHRDGIGPARFASSTLTPSSYGGDTYPDNDGSYSGSGDNDGSYGSSGSYGSGSSDDGGDSTATDPDDGTSDTTATTTDDGSGDPSSPCDDDSSDCSDGSSDPGDAGDPGATAPTDPGPANITVAPGVDPSTSVMDTLQGYFGDINARDWQAAFETFTSDQQARISPADIEKGAHDSTDTDITLNNLTTGNGEDTADVSFLADDEQPGGAGCQQWRLDYTMDGSDDSGWKMDLAEPLPGQPEAVAASGC